MPQLTTSGQAGVGRMEACVCARGAMWSVSAAHVKAQPVKYYYRVKGALPPPLSSYL